MANISNVYFNLPTNIYRHTYLIFHPIYNIFEHNKYYIIWLIFKDYTENIGEIEISKRERELEREREREQTTLILFIQWS